MQNTTRYSSLVSSTASNLTNLFRNGFLIPPIYIGLVTSDTVSDCLVSERTTTGSYKTFVIAIHANMCLTAVTVQSERGREREKTVAWTLRVSMKLYCDENSRYSNHFC